MYFPPEVEDSEIPSVIRRLKEITGWKPWEKRLTWLREGVKKSVAMPHFWQERFELELAFSTIHRRYKITGKYPRKNLTIDQQRFLSFAAMVVRCYERLSQHGQKRLRGMLLDSLKNDYGLGPLAYEIEIAAHLLTKEFDVTFHDLETGGGYDYLAVKDEIQIELECKFVTGDIGRQIHRKRLYQFSEFFIPRLFARLDRIYGGLFVHITIPGRLHGQNRQHASISEQVFRAIGIHNNGVQSSENHISVSRFSIENSPFEKIEPQFIQEKHIAQFIYKEFGIVNKNALALFRPRRHAVIVVLQSASEDKVLIGIHRQLKDSARKQFSGTMPAILCCHLADLNEQELLDTYQRKEDEQYTGLDYMTSDLILRRPQTMAVTYTAPGSIVHEPVMIGSFEQESRREVGPAYTIRNPNHPFANDTRYSLF